MYILPEANCAVTARGGGVAVCVQDIVECLLYIFFGVVLEV